MSERMLEDIERMSGNMSQRMLEGMSKRLSEKMS